MGRYLLIDTVVILLKVLMAELRKFLGNRGLILEFWNETSKSMSNLADVLSLNNTASDYILSFAEEVHFKKEIWNSYVSRMRGYFVPPHTGEYSFYVKAVDGAILYMSPDRNMANRVVHLEGAIGAYASVAARFFDTKFTSATTQKATQETQRISVRSKVQKENQEIHLENWSKQSAVNEIQYVVIDDTSGGYSGATFQLGLYGVYTGDIPFLDYITANGSSLNISVTEQKKGVPSGNVFLINMDGIPSPPISYNTTAANVETALMGMFGTRCPKTLTKPTSSVHYNFEDRCLVCRGLSGTRVTNVEAFCGKGTILNPVYLYKNNNGLHLTQNLKTIIWIADD
ncbi:hypothetical protein KUTeg_002451 [Tegillarca granosa]|uniref:PA14 domain-containing protein n=1 Tax=Tegillarca granosa TaxID=220873 RepID=A0ABQ9FUF9_TEGGR|nr:hypothetical protein KUTeg_002451 [Tegillarca granosa]